MTGCGMRDPCRELFIELKILTFPSLYIYQLIMFVNKNSELYITNDSVHNYNIRLKKIYINQLLILLSIKIVCYVKELKCTIVFLHI